MYKSLGKKILIISVLAFAVAFAYGQDSTGNIDGFATTKYFQFDDVLVQEITYLEVDSSLNEFHYFVPTLHNNFYSLGNTGSAVFSGSFEHNIAKGVQLVGDNYFIYKPSIGESRYYRTTKPYSRINYAVGSVKEQLIDVLHSQNITPQLNFSLNYKRLGSEGYYFHQKTSHVGFDAQINYLSKNENYGILANLLYYGGEIEENGGLKRDTSLNEEESLRRDALPVHLIAATNELDERVVGVRQWINIGRKGKKTVNDSISYNQKREPSYRLAHNLKYTQSKFRFRDDNPDSAYYAPILEDTNAVDTAGILPIDDQGDFRTLNNELSLRRFFGKQAFYISAGHEAVQVEQGNIDTSFQNYIGKVGFLLDLKNIVSIVEVGSIVAGYNKGDQWAELKNIIALIATDSLESNNKLELHMDGAWFVQRPAFLEENYSSDLFSWSRDYDKVTSLVGRVGLVFPTRNLSLGVYGYNISNVVYYDESAKVAQSNGGEVSFLHWYFTKKFSLGHLHLEAKVGYQTNRNRSVLRFPEVYTFNTLYYQGNMFKGELRLRVGFDVFYSSEYYANAYMPLTRQFHLQNSKLIGDYPNIDFFTAVKIKSARLFFRVSHLNQGVTGDNYLWAPIYPIPDRSFKFGVNWTFIN